MCLSIFSKKHFNFVGSECRSPNPESRSPNPEVWASTFQTLGLGLVTGGAPLRRTSLGFEAQALNLEAQT